MRTAALVALALAIMAPQFAHPSLDGEEVRRFVAVIEQVADPDPPGAEAARPPGGGLAAAPLSHAVRTAQDRQELLHRYGFTPDRWNAVARRILLAYEAERLAAPLAGGQRLATGSHRVEGLSPVERRELMAIMQTARADLAAFAAETEADRRVIAPFMGRLDQVAGL